MKQTKYEKHIEAVFDKRPNIYKHLIDAGVSNEIADNAQEFINMAYVEAIHRMSTEKLNKLHTLYEKRALALNKALEKAEDTIFGVIEDLS